jgi:hypothetical protein
MSISPTNGRRSISAGDKTIPFIHFAAALILSHFDRRPISWRYCLGLSDHDADAIRT